jgi:hypothetical protein
MLTPSRCGRMDQCVVMGPGTVGLMTFSGTSCTLRKLTLGGHSPGNSTGVPHGATATACTKPSDSASNGAGGTCSGLYFVIVDLMAGKDTVTILRELNQCFPFPDNDTQVPLLPCRVSECLLTGALCRLWHISTCTPSRASQPPLSQQLSARTLQDWRAR